MSVPERIMAWEIVQSTENQWATLFARRHRWRTVVTTTTAAMPRSRRMPTILTFAVVLMGPDAPGDLGWSSGVMDAPL
jgi:hypothetical protein